MTRAEAQSLPVLQKWLAFRLVHQQQRALLLRLTVLAGRDAGPLRKLSTKG
jgi:hypothetical protein